MDPSPPYLDRRHLEPTRCMLLSQQRLTTSQQAYGIQVGIVGSGSYEQSWRAIPTQRPGPRDMYPVLSGNLQVEHHSRVSRHQGGQRGGLWSSPAPTLHIPRITAQLCNRDRGVDNYVCRLGAMFIFRIFRAIHRAPIHNIHQGRSK